MLARCLLCRANSIGARSARFALRFYRTPRRELSNQPCRQSYLSMHKAAEPTPRHLRRSKLPWIRAFVLEAKNSDLMVSIFKKGQSRNHKAIRSEDVILTDIDDPVGNRRHHIWFLWRPPLTPPRLLSAIIQNNDKPPCLEMIDLRVATRKAASAGLHGQVLLLLSFPFLV